MKPGDKVRAKIEFIVDAIVTDHKGTIASGHVQAANGTFLFITAAKVEDCEVI